MRHGHGAGQGDVVNSTATEQSKQARREHGRHDRRRFCESARLHGFLFDSLLIQSNRLLTLVNQILHALNVINEYYFAPRVPLAGLLQNSVTFVATLNRRPLGWPAIKSSRCSTGESILPNHLWAAYRSRK